MKSVNLPDQLYKFLVQQLEDSPFTNMDDFLAYIIQNHFDSKYQSGEIDEEKEINTRLKNLGYL